MLKPPCFGTRFVSPGDELEKAMRIQEIHPDMMTLEEMNINLDMDFSDTVSTASFSTPPPTSQTTTVVRHAKRGRPRLTEDAEVAKQVCMLI